MKREESGPFLSAVFVDYDNIYLSLRRKSEEAAKRFAKDAAVWLKGIESGSLLTPTNGISPPGIRRIVMNRCYGNPVPRRNTSDNSTDMSSFPFVRHHFLRAGFEVVDCPPLTAQLKNSSDIRMVMDLRDYLDHETHFDEFVILSGDADFTPVLHRLRAHARRTVIYATDYTAAPYTAISDGEVREADLISLLLEGRTTLPDAAGEITASASSNQISAIRRAIMEDVVATVRGAKAPVPLEVLADHAVRIVGHDRTIGTGWAGAGGFRELLAQELPTGLKLSGEPPYVVIDVQRHLTHQPATPAAPIEPAAPPERSRETAELKPVRPRLTVDREPLENDLITRVGALREQPARENQPSLRAGLGRQAAHGEPVAHASTGRSAADAGSLSFANEGSGQLHRRPAARLESVEIPAQPSRDATISIQDSIARIHQACKAPPLAPPEYRALFEIIAKEITENGLIGAQTIQAITAAAQDRGLDITRDDVRFVLEVVSEADPWFEQGASPTLFAGRFRNFVVARCRAQGLALSADELDLVEAWFAGGTPTAAPQRHAGAGPTFAAQPPQRPTAAQQSDPGYWPGHDQRSRTAAGEAQAKASHPLAFEDAGDAAEDDMPRFVRTRLRS